MHRSSHFPSFSSRDEVLSLQQHKIKKILHNSYRNSSFYQANFNKSGVTPSDFHCLDDLDKFPFTDATAFHSGYPSNFISIPAENVSRIHVSSGSTGRPKVIPYSKNDLNTWSKLVARSLEFCGVTPQDTIQVTFAYGLFTGGLGCHQGAETLGASIIPASTGQTQRQIQLIDMIRPTVLMGTPSYLLKLLDKYREHKRDPRLTSLRLAIFGAETCSESTRKEIEEGFNVQAVDMYGMAELMGPGVAQESVSGKGCLTVWDDHFFAEIVDPVSLRPVPLGELGELVVTTLSKESCPLIRYRTHDLTRFLPESENFFQQIERIKGRTDDMFTIRGINCFPNQFEEIIGQDPRLNQRFQCEITTQNRLDSLTLKVEKSANQLDDHPEEVERMLQKKIREKIGITVNVKVVSQLSETNGKIVKVVDLRS